MSRLELRKRAENRAESYKEQLDHYRNNPLDYFVERLGVRAETIDWSLNPGYREHVWDGTENPFMKMLNGLINYSWVGIESGKGTGKTFIAACVVLWFLECFENSIVVTTAPKKEQLTLHVWKEMGELFKKFGKGYLDTLTLRMRIDEHGKKSYKWSAVGFVAGVDASEAEKSAKKAQGFHAEHMLIILEETPGVSQAIITAFEDTSTAKHNLILALGNPDNQFDTLHRFCSQDNVMHIRISCLDHPNVVTGNGSLIPGACTTESNERKLKRHGRDGDLYLGAVRGLSPGQSADSLIKMKWCIASRDETDRKREELLKGKAALGVDVANSINGDKAAIARGKGAVLLVVEDFQCANANKLGTRDVFRTMKEHDVEEDYVGVDRVGVGAGTVNALADIDIDVQALGGADSPVKIKGQEEEFNNLRSQMWWELREDLRLGQIILTNDEDLFADLVAPNWQTKRGKITVEGKEDFKKRLGRSPNKGDAVVYWNWARKKRTPKNIRFLKWK